MLMVFADEGILAPGNVWRRGVGGRGARQLCAPEMQMVRELARGRGIVGNEVWRVLLDKEWYAESEWKCYK